MDSRNPACYEIASKSFLSKVTAKYAATFINTVNTSRLKNLYYARVGICRESYFIVSAYIKIQRSSNHAQKSHNAKSFSRILKTFVFISFAEVKFFVCPQIII